MNEEEYPRMLSPLFTIAKAKVNSVEIPSVGQMKNVPCPPTQDTRMSTGDEHRCKPAWLLNSQSGLSLECGLFSFIGSY